MDKRNVTLSSDGVKVLSLFDGMSCGVIAITNAGLKISSYDAYEIDKYAIKTSLHNFPFIKHHGDVFKADFSIYSNVDYLIGGSPCTYWSIAQKNNRETEASGLGWELFSQYVRALYEAKPKYFIYENNKSMSVQIKDSITKAFGFEPICINSALVSAQNRKRLYWVGKRNNNGTYTQVAIEQPINKNIVLKDILESSVGFRNEKAYCLDANYFKGGNVTNFNKQSGQRLQVAEPIKYELVDYQPRAKSHIIINDNAIRCAQDKNNASAAESFVQFTDVKCGTMTTAHIPKIIEPARVGALPRPNGELSTSQAMRIYSVDGKSVAQSAGGGGMGGKTGLYAVPINTLNDEGEKSRTLMAGYYKYGTATLMTNKGFKGGTTAVAEAINVTEPIENVGECETVQKALPKLADKYGYIPEKFNAYNVSEITDKSPTLSTGSMVTSSCATTMFVSADGKKMPVYEVQNGLITINGKQYPIKLADGFYIIRKLTVLECMRLQTIPEWYDFSIVSSSQAYKMLGNGWTCDVITHLILTTIDNAE